jgi:single-strand DNA-binding protein
VSNDCNITVVGNLTRDPELRFTPGGKAVANLGVAINRRYQVNGEWTEKVSFYTVVAWDTLAENCAASFQKGTRVIVTGRIENRDWEDKDGNKRVTTEIVADDIGPSMRWAQAPNIEKTFSRQGDGPFESNREPEEEF